jgi:HEAT repeat protein
VDALLRQVEQGDPFIRRRAVDALGRIGPEAQAAAPTLARLRDEDRDPGVRQSAKIALDQIQLTETAQQTTEHAGPEIRDLIKRLLADDETAGAGAARALGQMGVKARDSVPALALALRSTEKWRRQAAASALAELGLLAADYAPGLQVAARDPEPEIRRAAEAALEQIEGKRR